MTTTTLPTLRDLGITLGPVSLSSHGALEVTVAFDDDSTPCWERVYSTNAAGHGLWAGDNQVQGTSQFSAADAASFRRALGRYLRRGGR